MLYFNPISNTCPDKVGVKYQAPNTQSERSGDPDLSGLPLIFPHHRFDRFIRTLYIFGANFFVVIIPDIP